MFVVVDVVVRCLLFLPGFTCRCFLRVAVVVVLLMWMLCCVDVGCLVACCVLCCLLIVVFVVVFVVDVGYCCCSSCPCRVASHVVCYSSILDVVACCCRDCSCCCFCSSLRP